MKSIKSLVALLALLFSSLTYALNDDQEMEFTGAVNVGDIKTVKMYVETMNVNLEDSYFAWTPLLMAAAKNQEEVLEYLVKKGADVNYVHPVTRWNASIHAAFNNNQKMVLFLSENGIDMQKKLKGDVSLVFAMRDQGNEEMAEYLLSLGVKDDGCNPIEDVCF